MTDTLTVADLDGLGIDPLACGRMNGEAARIWPSDVRTLDQDDNPLERRSVRFARDVARAFHAWEESRFGRSLSPRQLHFCMVRYSDKPLTGDEIDRLSTL